MAATPLEERACGFAQGGSPLAGASITYVSILGGAYFISRGLAKSGSPQPYNEGGDANR
jgi:hypothetical protein